MEHYDEKYWAERVGNYNKTDWVKNRKFIDSFLDMLPNQKISSILEVGIGTGVVAEKMVEKLGPLRGIDISPDMISKIENPNISATVGDAHNLKFENNTFELIYMRNVIHYIDHPEKALSEIFRCLKTGGYFLFSQVVPPDDSISEEYDWLVGRNIHYPTKTEIINWMIKFQIIKENDFILTGQSIMNWLKNTCNENKKKNEIINRHIETSELYKSMVNYSVLNDDIFVDIKHLMILTQKVK
jgi:ubiquinone/menaquinone biosynthesis C-methylase UbiE